ncbi:sigma-70 family RNA polymerase sigma factor [Solirubrobacter sp. CPCC 204708]|uniref:Sigma-70 family RNA polymerase sigma factor n=1 Tax=Solirubrobacter deserti TaxID=2282478 RepID=A0ABT4RQN4_9ACTN|nr:sigma-70 family RNA polymerase sigma factor [Solirubrobacter deserti]MBE2319377.1 sigma-70 family RNA polymerase sigma factor [Solirubrobacter deserti]MDA0140874.1 sigma-70 family RNA polymerase sigma factor [Solirubrobacter deserti]
MWNDERATRTDAELLAAAEQDAAAFGELYRRHVRRVHVWFERRIAWAAADLTAETFARAWMRRHGFRDEHDGWALPWLLGIAHNVLRESARRDRIESRARERLGLPLALAEDDEYAAVDDRLSPRLALAAVLDELPDHERDAVELRIIDELPYGEVARQLSIRPAAARLRVSRALRRLAQLSLREER